MAFDLQKKIEEIQVLAFEVAAEHTMKEILEACQISHPTLRGLISGKAKPCFSTVARVHKGLRKLTQVSESNAR